MRLINSDGQIVDAKVVADARGGGTASTSSARVDMGNLPQWLNATLAALGFFFGVAAFLLVVTRLDFYARELSREQRLQTQAIDEARVEANVSRRLAGQPVVDSHEHGSIGTASTSSTYSTGETK